MSVGHLTKLVTVTEGLIPVLSLTCGPTLPTVRQTLMDVQWLRWLSSAGTD